MKKESCKSESPSSHGKTLRLLIRWTLYLLGLAVLALGITLNTKTGLGVSAIVSVPYVCAVIGGWSIGNATLVSYVIFMAVQFALKRKEYKLADLLQLPLSIVFTRFMNLFSDSIPMQTNLTGQLVTLVLAVVLTGVGAAITLDMRLVPNPADGMVQAISDVTGKEMGLCKNLVDFFMALVSVIIALVLRGQIIGIGIGTLAAVLGVGRVMAFFNKLFLWKLRSAAGLNAPANL